MSLRYLKESVLSTVRTGRDPADPAQRSTAPQILPGAWGQLRPVARRVHFLAGILVAPLLLVLSLTGLAYVFSPQIHDDLYANQLYVDEVGDTPRPVAQQVAAAMAAHPEAELLSVVPPPAPDRTTRVRLSVPGRATPGEARTVYVDPYTNYINGELTTIDNRLPANVWLRDLHGNLHLGEVGRLYSETAASWLPVITVGGLALWIGKQGRRRRSARELLVPAPRGKGDLTRLRGVHGPLGLWLTVGLLTMSVTGLTMSQFAGWGLFDTRVPTLAAAAVDVPVGAGPIGLDRVLEVARAEGLSGELDVRPPAEPNRPFTVTEFSPGMPIQRDGIAVDPYTAEITERVGWDDYPLAAQLRVLAIEAHTGTLFGLANQIVLAVLAIGTIVLILVGYKLWWKRSPYRGQLPPAPPPALRGLTTPTGAAVVMVAVLLGCLMPVFGISLVAFIVVDNVINAVRRRQERVRSTFVAGALVAAGCVIGTAVLADTSPFAGQDDAPGTYPRPRPPDGGGSPGGGRAPGAVLDQPSLGNQAAPNGEPDAGMAPPTSWTSIAFPDVRDEVPADVADGTDGGSGSARGGTDAGRTSAAGFGRDDSGDGSGDSGDSAGAGSSGSRAPGAPVDAVSALLPPPVGGTVNDAADRLVGTVAVAKPVRG